MPKPENAWRYHFTHVYHKWKCVVFCPTNNPKKLKNQSFQKITKTPGDIIFYKSVPEIICNTVPEKWCVTDLICIFILGYFCPFMPLTAPKKNKIKNTKNNNKPLGDIIILHMYTKNYDHNMHGSWDVVHSRQMDRHADRSGI